MWILRINSARLAYIATLIIFIAGCDKDHSISERQEILFQYDYNNNAWGPEHSGYLIDNKGDVLTYNNPVGWNYSDDYYIMTEDKINENIQKCELTEVRIPIEELHKYSKYIRNIAYSKISAKRNVSNDAGLTRFICYKYSESTGLYEGHLIKMEGDYTCENLNFFSKKVAVWMRDISNNINSK